MAAAATITAPLAALTTIFTPPCSISWLLTSTKNPSQYPPFPTNGPASCDPPSWAGNIASRGFAFYSPAICPSGFEVGPGCQVTETRTGEGFPPVQAGETAVYCVPSGHSCTTDTTDFRGGVWGATSNRRGSPVFTIGPAVQIRFRESDLPLLATHPLTPGLVVGQNTPPAVAVSVTAGIVPLLTPATGGETQTLDSSSFVTSLPTNAPTNTGASVGGGALSSNMAASSGAIAGASPSSTGSTQISEGNALRNGAEDSRRGLPAGIVAVLVASTLAAFAVGVALLIRFRSSLYYRIPRNCWVWPWRRRRDNSLVPVGVGAWIGQRPRCDDDDDEEVWHGTGNPHSRLVKIAEVDRHSQLSEARQPLGSRENPAEMEGDLEYVHGLTRQASWISRFLSRIPRSSTTTSSRSRWTQRSLSLSGDWETLLHEKDGGGVAVPDVVYSRPGTLSWSNSDEDIFHGKKPSLREPAKVRSFDRLSEGTFGRVLVRGKSPGASSSSMGY